MTRLVWTEHRHYKTDQDTLEKSWTPSWFGRVEDTDTLSAFVQKYAGTRWLLVVKQHERVVLEAFYLTARDARLVADALLKVLHECFKAGAL